MIYAENYKVTTAPSSEPVSLTEAKLHLRITSTDEDTLITSLIKVAREWAEQYENRAYITQTITAHYSSFASRMFLPISPALTITSITYIDGSGDTQTLSSTEYNLESYSEPAYIYPSYNSTFPSHRDDVNTITVVYQAGYTTVPERVKAAIKLILSHLYEHREENSEVSLSTIPFSAKNLLFNRIFI